MAAVGFGSAGLSCRTCGVAQLQTSLSMYFTKFLNPIVPM